MAFSRIAQYNQQIKPYDGIAESAVTSNILFTGDARAVFYSVTSSSGTASKWTILGNESDGFQTALDDSAWQPLKTVTAQGYGSFDTIPRWAKFLRTPSTSSTTFYLTLAVGP